MSPKSGIDKRRHRRHARRIPCQLFVGERVHSALVLDLTRVGLFIQTHARPHIAERLRVELAHVPVPIQLIVEVARSKSVPPSLLSAAKGGLGVRIVNAPQEYDDLLTQLGIGNHDERVKLAAEPGQRFRVHVAVVGGSRSRRIEIMATHADEAGALALAALGKDWKVLRVQAIEP
jgi:PilZ domain